MDTALDGLKNPPEGAAGPMIFLGPILAPLADGLKPAVNGNRVSTGLQGDALKTIANLIVTFRANAAPPPAPGARKPGE